MAGALAFLFIGEVCESNSSLSILSVVGDDDRVLPIRSVKEIDYKNDFDYRTKNKPGRIVQLGGGERGIRQSRSSRSRHAHSTCSSGNSMLQFYTV